MAARGYQQALGTGNTTNASSTVWVDQVTATFNLDASSTYLVLAYCEEQVNNTTAQDGQVRLFDGTTALCTSNFRNVSADASEWTPVNQCALITTTSAATPTLGLQHKVGSASSGRLSSARNGVIVALKLGANDVSFTNDVAGTSTAAAGSWTDYAPASGTSTLTFTPGTTGDYLIFAFAMKAHSNTTTGARVALLCEDGTTRQINDTWSPASNSSSKVSYCGFVKRTGLTNSSKTFKLQHSRHLSSGTSTLDQVRMVAFRLDDFDSSNITEDTTSRTTTSGTYVDLGSTQTDTLTSGIDYLLLGNYRTATDNNSILYSAKITDGTNDYSEGQRKESWITGQGVLGQMVTVPRIVAGTGASVTHRLKGKITSVLTETSNEHRIAILQVEAAGGGVPTTTISAPSGTTAVATGIKVAVGSCLAGVGVTARAEGHKEALYAASGVTAKAAGLKVGVSSTQAAAGATARATGAKTATGSALAAQGATARAGGFKATAYVGATARATGAKIAIGSDKAAVGLGILNAGRKLASASTSASVGIGVVAGGYKAIANLGVSVRASGSKVGLASLTGTVGVTAQATGLKVGLAALPAAAGATARPLGLKVGVGSASAAIGLGVRAGGYKLTGALGTTANALGLKVGLGSVNASAGVTATVLKTGAVATSLRAAVGVTAWASGSRVALAALRASTGATMAATGSRTTQGAARAAVGLSTTATARKLSTGALSAPVGATARPGGVKVVGMVVVAQVGVSTVAGGVKVARSPILGTVGVVGLSITGRKTAVAEARTAHGVTARAFSSGGVSFGELLTQIGVTARVTGTKVANAGLYCSLGVGATIGVAPFQPSMAVRAVLTSGGSTTAVLVGPAVANLGPSDAHATLRE